jgi:hypothetical protein
MTALIIAPLFQPFPLSLTTEFWDDDNASRVSAFSTGVRRRDGDGCIIGGCDFDLPKCVDDAHIIQREDNKTVRTPNMPLKWFANLCSGKPSRSPNISQHPKEHPRHIHVTAFGCVKFITLFLMPISFSSVTSLLYLPLEF